MKIIITFDDGSQKEFDEIVTPAPVDPIQAADADLPVEAPIEQVVAEPVDAGATASAA